MSHNVVYLHGRPREVAQVTRVGFFEHRQCEHLLSSNKLASRRFVVEAANVDRQASLLRTLQDAAAEIVLDTNVAELSALGRFSGAVKSAPWAVDGRMLEPDDFTPGTNRSVIEPIARFAVSKGMTAVMAPAHYLGDQETSWLSIDLRSAAALRVALDREGGQNIAVDYPLVVTYRQLRDPDFRRTLLLELSNVPFDRLWLRVDGFGADATGAGISRYIEAVRPLHALERPILSDQLGGLAGLAACAFGAVSGFANGIEGKQRFDASDWLKPKSSGGGGRAKKIYVQGLDRWIEVSEARRMFDDTRSARSIFGCSDVTCCGDIDRMLGSPEAHFVVQQGRAVSALSSMPESVRADRFLHEQLGEQVKEAQRATRLKKISDDTRKKVTEAAKRLTKINDALVGLYQRNGEPHYALEAAVRSSTPRPSQASQTGRTP